MHVCKYSLPVEMLSHRVGSYLLSTSNIKCMDNMIKILDVKIPVSMNACSLVSRENLMAS